MKYDDATWHSDGEFPATSPVEFGGTHIALMLKWCFLKGWAGELHTEDEDSAQDLERLLRGDMSATEYLLTWCDGKFTDEDLNAEGNAFMRHYYNGLYDGDFDRNFGPRYVLPESAHDFGKFSEMVEARYRAFLAADAIDGLGPDAPPSRRPWWQFW